jgi:hypothetical protein
VGQLKPPHRFEVQAGGAAHCLGVYEVIEIRKFSVQVALPVQSPLELLDGAMREPAGSGWFKRKFCSV